MFALALLAILPLRFHYDASEFTNVVYHVNCLTGRVSCTNSVYSNFWNNEYHVTRADGDQLDKWRDTVRKIENAAPAPPPAPVLPNYASFYPSLIARNRVVTAALEAGSANEFRKRAAGLLDSEDAAVLSGVLDHFQHRLHPWWVSFGRAAVARHIRDVEKRMKTSNLLQLTEQVAAFAESNLQTRDVYIHAIPGPAPESRDASATVISNHFFVEVIRADKPEYTIWKAIHELTHAFYDSAPLARHLLLMREFVETEEAHSPVFYSFLNEALATAVQLLVYERMGIKDDDPYRDPYIPRLAQATLPLLKEALSGRRTLFSGFAPGYLRAAAEALRDDASNPRFFLSSTAILASDQNLRAHDAFLERFQPRFFVTQESEWKLFEDLNAVRLLTFDELGPYTSQVPDFLMKSRGFAYVQPYGRKSNVIFVAGRDGQALADAVQGLASLNSLPVNGVALTLDGATH